MEKKSVEQKKERELVVLMEDDMPSFSHPQLPQLPSSLLLHTGLFTSLPGFYRFVILSVALSFFYIGPSCFYPNVVKDSMSPVFFF